MKQPPDNVKKGCIYSLIYSIIHNGSTLYDLYIAVLLQQMKRDRIYRRLDSSIWESLSMCLDMVNICITQL